MKIRLTLSAIITILLFIQSFNTVLFAQAMEDNNFVLKNKNVELIFEKGENFLFKEFTMDGVNILPPNGSTNYPWQMTFIGPNGENPTLQPKWGEYKGGEIHNEHNASTLIFTWEMFLDGEITYPVRMLVKLLDEAELPEWHIEADVPEGWIVTESEFPRISVEQPEGAKAILPVAYGTEYTLGSSGQLQSRYPSGTGSMQLLLMHDARGTVYYSAQDKSASGKSFKMKSEGNNLTFIQNVTTSHDWTQNNKFELPWSTVMGFTKETWENAVAKWYRPFTFETQWGAKKISERSIVEWIKKADMWLRPMHANAETMEDVRKALTYFGKGVGLHWYYWHQHLFDTKYPEYFPAKEGFAEMVREAQELGGYVTPYINGRLWDPSTESYKTLNGKDASCRKADGTLYTEVYGSKVINTVTCPASYIWRNVQKGVNQQILTDLKTDGVYIDQIGAAKNEPCYASNHGHPLGGGSWWHLAYRSLLNEMRGTIYKENQAITTEENAECYIDLFDMMLIVNSPHNSYTKMVPLFPIVYSDRCIYSGYTYIPWRITDGSLNFMTMKSLLWGSQLGWAEPEALMRPESKREAAFLKKMTDFRRQQHDLFVGGRFVKEIVPKGDNPTLAIPNFEETPVVMASEWISTSGKHAYIVVNMDENDHTVTMPNDEQVTLKSYEAVRIEK